MIRRKIKGTKVRTTQARDTEPDFYTTTRKKRKMPHVSSGSKQQQRPTQGKKTLTFDNFFPKEKQLVYSTVETIVDDRHLDDDKAVLDGAVEFEEDQRVDTDDDLWTVWTAGESATLFAI
jgi:hypothetical protein